MGARTMNRIGFTTSTSTVPSHQTRDAADQGGETSVAHFPTAVVRSKSYLKRMAIRSRKSDGDAPKLSVPPRQLTDSENRPARANRLRVVHFLLKRHELVSGARQQSTRRVFAI